MVSATVIDLGGKPSVMSICHDIADIKKIQEALQVSNRKLNHLSEITRRDIRNQLTVLKGYLKLCRDHPPEPQHAMYLTKLRETVSTIGITIKFTKLYQNLGVVAPDWQNIHEVFIRACTHADLKRIRIHSSTQGLSIYADPLLERVFYNLIENSVQHGNRVREIRIGYFKTPEDLLLTIEDDGIGVPDYDKERIFSRGFGRNTGLGLFLAREILSTTGITLTETGTYQQCTRFEISVPKGSYGSSRRRCSGNPPRPSSRVKRSSSIELTGFFPREKPGRPGIADPAPDGKKSGACLAGLDFRTRLPKR